MRKTPPGDTAIGFGSRLARFLSTNRTFITIWLALFIAIIGITMPSLNAITVEKGRIMVMVSVFRIAALLGLGGIVIFNVFMRRNARISEKIPDVL